MSGVVALAQGDAILIPSGGKMHLHIMCNEPVFTKVSGSAQVLTVSICSILPGLHHDPTCIIEPGDHAFIRHDSYVSYRHSIIYSAEGIRRKLVDGSIERHARCNDDLRLRILSGICLSNETPHKAKRFYEKHIAG